MKKIKKSFLHQTNEFFLSFQFIFTKLNFEVLTTA